MKILVQFAHPRVSSSVVQRAMLDAVADLDNVRIRDLYALYPDFEIDIGQEQELLLAHDLIVLQHPFYWYSCPAIVKEWLDLVLENGWAYGPGGDRLHRKFLMSAVSTGGSDAAYQSGGLNRFEVASLLSPFDQTAYLCGLAWLEPFVVYQGRRLDSETLDRRCRDYRELISSLRDGHLDPFTRLATGYSLPASFGAAVQL